jgi:thioredoxin-related protein
MKNLALITSLFALTLLPLRADDAWMTDHAKALEKAKVENKPVVMDFTGSDWCGWCIKLDKEVFNTPAFKSYAEKNLVLLKLDFPRRKALPPALKKQNEELASKHGIRGYPTIIVLNPEGNPIGQLGYRPGGPQAWIAELEKSTKKP